jgi:TIR domain
MTGKIFINYRRGDDPGYTGRLFDWLQDVFERQQLFIDVDNIAPGLDFVSELDQRVGECDVMLTVIGKGWIDARDAKGARRLDDPGDFVRIEIESALSQNKRVIPVLVGEAQMPQVEDLPDPLKPLTRRNAVRVTHERFSSDVQGLIKALQETLCVAEVTRPAATIRVPRDVQQAIQTGAASQMPKSARRLSTIHFSSVAIISVLITGATAYFIAGGRHAPIVVSRAPQAPSPQPDQPADNSSPPTAPPRPLEAPQPSIASPQPIPAQQPITPNASVQPTYPETSPPTSTQFVDLITLRNTLPASVPVNSDMLRFVQTNSFFANAPPIRLTAYSIMTKGKNIKQNTVLTGRVRPLVSGMAPYVSSSVFYNETFDTTGLWVGNGLFALSWRTDPKTGKDAVPKTTEAIQIRSTGSIFPMVVGKHFSYGYSAVTTKLPTSETSPLTLDNNCEVTGRQDASEFYKGLTGEAFTVRCADATGSPFPFNKIFFEQLGFFLIVDSIDGKTVVRTSDVHTVLTNVSFFTN